MDWETCPDFNQHLRHQEISDELLKRTEVAFFHDFTCLILIYFDWILFLLPLDMSRFGDFMALFEYLDGCMLQFSSTTQAPILSRFLASVWHDNLCLWKGAARIDRSCTNRLGTFMKVAPSIVQASPRWTEGTGSQVLRPTKCWIEKCIYLYRQIYRYLI